MRFFHSRPEFRGALVLCLSIACVSSSSSSSAIADTTLPASVTSHDQSTPLYFSIPAPRGQILDARGASLARTTTVRRLMLQVPPLPNETPELFGEWVKTHWPEVLQSYPDAIQPTDEFLIGHFKSRRMLPIAISSAKPNPPAENSTPEPAPLNYLSWRAEYQRDYPHAEAAAHVIGYVAPVGPIASGPLHHGEPLWRNVEGREGLEGSLNKELAGRPGLLMMNFNNKTLQWEEKVISAPQPGNDVVTTLSLPTQKSAETALAEAKRPGALVIVDASNGDILAMASAPTFNPAIFAAGMNQEDFDQFTAQPAQPLHHRAIVSQYPPGSVFKPFVALGILKSGAVQPETRFLCGPELDIDGRKFGNWSDSDYGMFDLRAAMIRSCNTYFYQAAITSGSKPIREVARDFGFGHRPAFPLPNLAAGNLPAKVTNRQALANLSIGQGDVLVCPLQVAVAMAALANDGGRPSPRLVSQVQSQQQSVLSITSVKALGVLDSPPEHLEAIRTGMYGVVNHQQGTATKARQKEIPIFGKTGTAQWTNQGKQANVVWFGGFVMHSTPPIAFVVALEGKPGETISGGQTAAPVMAKVLADIFASPEEHGIKMKKTDAPFQDDPLIGDPAMVPVLASQVAAPVPATVPVAPLAVQGPRPSDALLQEAAPVIAAASPAATPTINLTTVATPATPDKPVTKTMIVAPAQESAHADANADAIPAARSVAAQPSEIGVDVKDAPPPPPPKAIPAEAPAKKTASPTVVVVPKAQAVESPPQPPTNVVPAPAPVPIPIPVAEAVDAPPPAAPVGIEAPKALPVADANTAVAAPPGMKQTAVTPAPTAEAEAPPPAKAKRKGFLFFGNGDDEDENQEKDKDD